MLKDKHKTLKSLTITENNDELDSIKMNNLSLPKDITRAWKNEKRGRILAVGVSGPSCSCLNCMKTYKSVTRKVNS